MKRTQLFVLFPTDGANVVIIPEESGMRPGREKRFLHGGVTTCKHSDAQVNMGIRLFIMYWMRTYLA
jgi:hypothetical protein